MTRTHLSFQDRRMVADYVERNWPPKANQTKQGYAEAVATATGVDSFNRNHLRYLLSEIGLSWPATPEPVLGELPNLAEQLQRWTKRLDDLEDRLDSLENLVLHTIERHEEALGEVALAALCLLQDHWRDQGRGGEPLTDHMIKTISARIRKATTTKPQAAGEADQGDADPADAGTTQEDNGQQSEPPAAEGAAALFAPDTTGHPKRRRRRGAGDQIGGLPASCWVNRKVKVAVRGGRDPHNGLSGKVVGIDANKGARVQLPRHGRPELIPFDRIIPWWSENPDLKERAGA